MVYYASPRYNLLLTDTSPIGTSSVLTALDGVLEMGSVFPFLPVSDPGLNRVFE